MGRGEGRVTEGRDGGKGGMEVEGTASQCIINEHNSILPVHSTVH